MYALYMSVIMSAPKLKSLLKAGSWTNLKLKRKKDRWIASGFLPKERKDAWKEFADAHGLASKVNFQITKVINFDPDEFARMERIAAHLGMSFSSYLRLAERRCSAQILRVWEEVLDFRAKEFVASSVGLETKRNGIHQNKGLKYARARLQQLRADNADAEAAVFPTKPQRSEWFPLSPEGDSHEQWVTKNLLDPRKEFQELGLKAVAGPLTEFFCAAVDRHRLNWLQLTDIQLRVEDRYVGGNRKLSEGFRRDLEFAEEGLRTLKKGQPLGYRRFRQWASQSSSREHPQGRGIVRWQVEKESLIGGDGFYDELKQCPKPRIPDILRRQLEKWRDHCREQLKHLEKRLQADDERLQKLKSNPEQWYDIHYLERLLANDHGAPKSIKRRLTERLRPEVGLREEPQHSIS